MPLKNSIYKTVHEADGWISFEDIISELEETYSNPDYLSVREDINELRDEHYIEKADSGLEYRVKG